MKQMVISHFLLFLELVSLFEKKIMKIKKAVLEDAKRKRDTEERRSHYLFLLSSLSRRPSSAMKELKTYFSLDPRLMHPMIYIFIFYLIFFFRFVGGRDHMYPCVYTQPKRNTSRNCWYIDSKRNASAVGTFARHLSRRYTRSHDNDVKKGQTSVRSKREKKKKCRNMSTSKSFKKKEKKKPGK